MSDQEKSNKEIMDCLRESNNNAYSRHLKLEKRLAEVEKLEIKIDMVSANKQLLINGLRDIRLKDIERIESLEAKVKANHNKIEALATSHMNSVAELAVLREVVKVLLIALGTRESDHTILIDFKSMLEQLEGKYNNCGGTGIIEDSGGRPIGECDCKPREEAELQVFLKGKNEGYVIGFKDGKELQTKEPSPEAECEHKYGNMISGIRTCLYCNKTINQAPPPEPTSKIPETLIKYNTAFYNWSTNEGRGDKEKKVEYKQAEKNLIEIIQKEAEAALVDKIIELGNQVDRNDKEALEDILEWSESQPKELQGEKNNG